MCSIKPSDVHAVAACIDTGTADADTSRALVVFNVTDQPLGGFAVFHADMSWPKGTPLPTVSVMDIDGTPVVSAITAMAEGPDRKGRADRYQLSFNLRFDVRDVPARGWKTYIAAYTPVPSLLTLTEVTETSGLLVIETTRHAGDLPPVGTFADCGPSVVQ